MKEWFRFSPGASKPRIFLALTATLYAGAILYFCLVIPAWGRWYSRSAPFRAQTDAFLRGELALSHNPADLRLSGDLCWSQRGVQQVWGLGIPLWRLPFEALARACGQPAFPDRLALGLFMALAAFVVLDTWCGRITGIGAATLFLFFAPLLNILRGRMSQYEEVLVYEYLFALMLICGTVALSRHPSWRRFWALCALAGLGGLIRPTLIFYGAATVAVAGLAMIRQAAKTRTPAPLCLRRSLAAAFWFSLGNGLLGLSNRVRFGSFWAFGHQLNLQPPGLLPAVYLTRFEFPFIRIPWTQAARELFGALFLCRKFTGSYFFLSAGLFPGQSPVFRFREFNFSTFDISYAGLLVLACAAATASALRRQPSRSSDDAGLARTDRETLILWSALSGALMAAFYLRVCALADRYMLDFAPAFAAAIASLWLAAADQVARLRRKRLALSLLFAPLWSWQVAEIARSKNNSGPPASVAWKDMRSKIIRPGKTPSRSFPDEYRLGEASAIPAIPYNATGWDSSSGRLSVAAEFFVENPEFLELELEPARIGAGGGKYFRQASPPAMRAKVGLEFLRREHTVRTSGGWIVRFAGPQQRRYQRGLQPVFLATVPNKDLGRYALTHAPWVLKRLSWHALRGL